MLFGHLLSCQRPLNCTPSCAAAGDCPPPGPARTNSPARRQRLVSEAISASSGFSSFFRERGALGPADPASPNNHNAHPILLEIARAIEGHEAQPRRLVG